VGGGGSAAGAVHCEGSQCTEAAQRVQYTTPQWAS